MRLALICLGLSALWSAEAQGQICSISSYPPRVDRSFGSAEKLLKSDIDIPFAEESRSGTRYANLWVNADVLNVRAGPGLSYDIVSETYHGNLVPAFAKRGDWIAISNHFQHEDVIRPPKWVRADFLSARRTKTQVSVDVLEHKCSFEAFGTYKAKLRRNEIYDPCLSVVVYLSHQTLLNQKHPYLAKYEGWRQSQENPEQYRKPPCGI